MVGLYNIGFSLEQEFGTPKIALIFVVSGLVGVWCSAVFVPNTTGVGASGAIFGLFGAAWVGLPPSLSLLFSLRVRLTKRRRPTSYKTGVCTGREGTRIGSCYSCRLGPSSTSSSGSLPSSINSRISGG